LKGNKHIIGYKQSNKNYKQIYRNLTCLNDKGRVLSVKQYTLDGTGNVLPELLDAIENSEGVFCGIKPKKLSGGGGGGGGCA
jgi:hypothetical protein